MGTGIKYRKGLENKGRMYEHQIEIERWGTKSFRLYKSKLIIFNLIREPKIENHASLLF